jgi:hypothetical protein
VNQTPEPNDIKTAVDDIRTAVDDILAGADVDYSAAFVCADKKPQDGGYPAWEYDKWRVSFTRGAVREEQDFKTGIGLRAQPTAAQRQAAWLAGLTQKDIDTRTIYGRRYLAAVEALRKPQAPRAACVLHSMLLDADLANESFDDWCSSLGYDSDSRKALATYLECQAEGAKLRRLFDSKTLQALREALQDY